MGAYPLAIVRCLAFCVLLPVAILMSFGLAWQVKAQEARTEGKIIVTIVYDNCPLDKRLETAWGFGCVIEGLPETILFDTGRPDGLLVPNMAKLGLTPQRIGSVVLSHIHSDHTGGLRSFLKANRDVTVYVPQAFPMPFRRRLRFAAARMVETTGPQRICDGLWTTGVLGNEIAEQGLCLETSQGLVVITGCAHPRIDVMAEAARKHFSKPIYAVLGGFHMGKDSPEDIAAVIEDLKRIGVQQAGPTHCTGDRARRSIKEAFGKNYLSAGAGARFVFDHPKPPAK